MKIILSRDKQGSIIATSNFDDGVSAEDVVEEHEIIAEISVVDARAQRIAAALRELCGISLEFEEGLDALLTEVVEVLGGEVPYSRYTRRPERSRQPVRATEDDLTATAHGAPEGDSFFRTRL